MEDITYDKVTGKLYRNKKEMGYITEVKGRTRYRRTDYKGKTYAVHRLIWEIHFGKIPKGMIIDHIDGNGLNNRLENLRICTFRENAFNRKTRLNNKSGYKGVQQHRRHNGKLCKLPWRVQIVCDGKVYTKSGFKTAKEAAVHYNSKAVELYGEFANLNKI